MTYSHVLKLRMQKTKPNGVGRRERRKKETRQQIFQAAKMLFETFSHVLKEGRKRLAAIIERGQQIGEVRRDIPAIELARCLHQAAFGTSFIWAISPPSDLIAWQEQSMDLFWRGIAVNPDQVSQQSVTHEETAARQ